ncbi:MAG: ETC complex I subunit [Hyphomonadaceae bacterium]
MLAKIYRPAKNAMQSGKAQTKKWRLEFMLASAPRPDALMGWVSSADPNGQVRMSFDTKEAAIAFARDHGIPHQVADPPETKRVIRSYSDNFAFRRREPWSH